MGNYIYTARATGRVKRFVDGDNHWVFPCKFEYKVSVFQDNTRFAERALRTAVNTEQHPDWEGYIQFNGEVYRNCDAWFSDYAAPGELVK